MTHKKTNRTSPSTAHSITVPPRRLLGDIRGLIENARTQTARAIDARLVTLHWTIAARIREEFLHRKRAEYGETVVETLAGALRANYGRGFSRRNFFNIVRFADVFPRRKMVQTLSAQLGWSHFLQLLTLDDSLRREFYAEMCRVERWSVRVHRRKIAGMLFERMAILRKPIDVARLRLRRE